MTNKRASWIIGLSLLGILWLWHYADVTKCENVAIYKKCRNYFD